MHKGACLRFPPQFLVYTQSDPLGEYVTSRQAWPHTSATEWCGEWKGKEE